jgi:hypothetical protein
MPPQGDNLSHRIERRFGPILLQKSKVAGRRIFREITKREAIADSYTRKPPTPTIKADGNVLFAWLGWIASHDAIMARLMKIGKRCGLTNSATRPVVVRPQPLFKSHAVQIPVDNCCCLLATLGNRRYCEWVRSLRRGRVSPRIERYLDKAKECERMAAQAKKRQADFLTQDARQWRDLARQAEYWERVRDMMPENLRRIQSTPLLPSIFS